MSHHLTEGKKIFIRSLIYCPEMIVCFLSLSGGILAAAPGATHHGDEAGGRIPGLQNHVNPGGNTPVPIPERGLVPLPEKSLIPLPGMQRIRSQNHVPEVPLQMPRDRLPIPPDPLQGLPVLDLPAGLLLFKGHKHTLFSPCKHI